MKMTNSYVKGRTHYGDGTQSAAPWPEEIFFLTERLLMGDPYFPIFFQKNEVHVNPAEKYDRK
jgi:hypothetical protein